MAGTSHFGSQNSLLSNVCSMTSRASVMGYRPRRCRRDGSRSKIIPGSLSGKLRLPGVEVGPPITKLATRRPLNRGTSEPTGESAVHNPYQDMIRPQPL